MMLDKIGQNLFKLNYIILISFYTVYLIFNFNFYLIFLGLLIFIIPFIKYGKEINKGHGIELEKNSRLGGLIIFITLIIAYYTTNNFKLGSQLFESFNFFLIVLVAISLLGLVDDLFGKLGHLIRLYFNIFAIFILLYTNQVFLFEKTNLNIVNLLLEYKLITYLITIFIIVGFINASNISDGANGILSGIATIIFLIFYFETGNLVYITIFEIILFFFLYNLIIGKVYLGDAGSYLLGFLISTNSLYLYNEKIIPAGLLACILCYPSIEVLMTIIRRLLKLKNPLLPDNFHLHNLIHDKFKSNKYTLTYSNSMTGVIILFLFAFPGIVIYLFLSQELYYLFWPLFCIQFLLYIIIYRYLKN